MMRAERRVVPVAVHMVRALALLAIWIAGDRAPVVAEPAGPMPDQAPPPARISIDEALERRIDFVVAEKPLSAAVDQLSKTAGVPIVIDRKAFSDLGLDPNANVSLALKQRRLKSILAHLAAEIGAEWVDLEGAILVTSPEGSLEHLRTRAYLVGDLVGEENGWEFSNSDRIVDFLTMSIAPTTWDTVGGPGSFGRWGDLLVVSQSHPVHGEIELAFATLRKCRASYEKWSGRDHAIPDLPSDGAWSLSGNDPTWEAARQKKITLDLEKASLADAVKRLEETTGLTFSFDRRSLGEIAEEEEPTPITYSCRDKPLEEALREIFEPRRIAFFPWHESIRLAAGPDPSQQRLETWVFPVFDLEIKEGTQQLVDEVIACVDEASWDTNGGPGSCTYLDPARAIVVNQTLQHQQKIAAFLAEKRRNAPVAKKPDPPTDDDWVTEAYAGRMDQHLLGEEVFQRGDEYARVIRAFIDPPSWDQPGSRAKIEVERSATPGMEVLPVFEQVTYTHRRSVVPRIRRLIDELEGSFDGFVAVPERATPLPPAKPAPAEQLWKDLSQRRVELEGAETPFAELIEKLAGQGKVSITFDDKGLTEAGFDPQTPITTKLKDVSFPAAMDHLLRRVNLGWGVTEKGVVVTSPEGAADFQFSKSYGVDDIVGPSAVRDPETQLELLLSLASSSIPRGNESEETVTRIQLSGPAPVVTETPYGHTCIASFLDAARRSRASMLKWDGATRPAPGLPAEGSFRLPDPAGDAWEKGRRQLVTLQFHEAPFHLSLTQLSKQTGIPFLLDERALADAGIALDTPITFECRRLPLQTALRRILAEHQLAPLVWSERVVISTRDESLQRLTTRIYPVFDLGWDSSDNLCRRTDHGGYLPDLPNVIQATIGPSDWDLTGGMGHIEYLPRAGALVVTQTLDHHEAIAALLGEMRRKMPLAANPKPLLPADAWGVRVHRLPAKQKSSLSAEQIAERMRGEIAGGSWGETEAPGKLMILGDRLIVRQSMRVQHQIADFLRKLEAPRESGARP